MEREIDADLYGPPKKTEKQIDQYHCKNVVTKKIEKVRNTHQYHSTTMNNNVDINNVSCRHIDKDGCQNFFTVAINSVHNNVVDTNDKINSFNNNETGTINNSTLKTRMELAMSADTKFGMRQPQTVERTKPFERKKKEKIEKIEKISEFNFCYNLKRFCRTISEF